jgi:uncharacterized membrane protein YfbV (UPF0208 family)
MNEASAELWKSTLPSEVIASVTILHLLVWLLTTNLTDGGVACAVYSCMVALYWAIIGVLWLGRLAIGRTLARIVAWTGWMPLAGHLLWLLGVFRR